MKNMKRLTLILWMALIALGGSAQISRYIKVTATGTGDGTSWENAAGTADIQTMINAVAADSNKGTVYFAEGTYLLTATIDVKNGVQMKGAYAGDGSGVRNLLTQQTIFDGQNARRILRASDSENPPFSIVTVIEGFILQRGSSSYGSAAVISLGTVLENCIIRNNNGTTLGAAVFIKKNTSIPNQSPQNTYKNFKTAGALVNCLIINNKSSNVSAGVWAETDSHFSIINCVIANNLSTDETNGVGGLWFGNNIHYTQIQNTIFYNNSGASANNIKTISSALRVTKSNWFSDNGIPATITLGDGSDNNISSANVSSPDFTLPTSFQGSSTNSTQRAEIEASDWRLKSTSGLKGLGNSTQGIKFPYENMNASTVALASRSFASITTDIQGNTRNLNSAVDLGAYEYDPITSTVSSSNNSHGTVNANQEVSKGSKITQTATPEAGYRFINWTESGTEVSTDASYTFTATSNRTLQANFASNTVNVTEATNTNATSLNNCADCDITVTGATLTVNNTKSVKSVTVEPGAKVVANQPLTVTGSMKLKAGKTTAPGVKVDAAINVTGNLTLEKMLDNTRWYFISLPSTVAIADISKVSGAEALQYGVNWSVKYYDGASRAANSGASSNWKTLGSNASLEANKGYIIGLAASLTGDYVLSFPLSKSLVASAETTDMSVPVAVHGGNPDGNGDNHKGWNLVGSPFLSSLSVDAIGAPFVSVYNGTTYTQTATTEVASVNPFSSFFVQASTLEGGTGLNLNFETAGRQLVKSLVDNSIEKVQLTIATAGGSDRTTLVLDENQSTTYSINHDLEKWLITGTGVPQLFTQIDNVKYAYNALPVSAVEQLQLGVYTGEFTQARIAMANKEQVSLPALWLNDLQTGKSINLKEEEYTFTTNASLELSRFELSLQRITTANDMPGASVLVTANSTTKSIQISRLPVSSQVVVYDVAGKIVHTATVSTTDYSVYLPENGFYQVQLIINGNSSVKKLVL